MTNAPLKVLVIEDNPVNQKLLCVLLQKENHEVVVADNGAEGVGIFKKQAFDLILMDIQMPVMNGVDATIHIREIERGSRERIPIVAVTAHAMEGDEERYLEAGMDSYVAKPINKEVLLNTIKDLTENRIKLDPALPAEKS